MRSSSDIAAAKNAGVGPGTPVSPEAETEELDSQQAVLLGVLRRAAGAPVSYEQLREAGIEFPASVASELELAGIEIEHCHLDRDATDPHRSREPGLRLVPLTQLELEPTAVLASPRPASPRPASPRPDRRWLAPLALLAAVVAIVAVLVATLAGGSAAPQSRDRVSAARHPAATQGADHAGGGAHSTKTSAARATTAPHPTTTSLSKAKTETQAGAQPARSTQSQAARHGSVPSSSAAPAEAIEVSATLAAQLEGEGHSLLEGGQAGAAIPVLSKALAATGEQPGDCLQPASEACLTYAYALYDLGRALLQSGDASAAVPVLQRRLQIDNQRPTVQAELATARADAG